MLESAILAAFYFSLVHKTRSNKESTNLADSIYEASDLFRARGA